MYLIYKAAEEFSKVVVANGRHDIRRCTLCQDKDHGIKIFQGALPLDPFHPLVIPIRDNTLLATLVDKCSLLKTLIQTYLLL